MNEVKFNSSLFLFSCVIIFFPGTDGKPGNPFVRRWGGCSKFIDAHKAGSRAQGYFALFPILSSKSMLRNSQR